MTMLTRFLSIVIAIFYISVVYSGVQAQDTSTKMYSAGTVQLTFGEAFTKGGDKLSEGYKIQLSDTLFTGDDGYIEFDFPHSSRIHLMANSQLLFHQTEHLNRSELRIRLLSGEMLVETAESLIPLQVTTPTAISSASNARYTIKIEDNGSTIFTGIHGTVEVTAASSGETQMLARRNKLSTDMRGQYFTVQQISNREVDGVINTFNRFNRTNNLPPPNH